MKKAIFFSLILAVPPVLAQGAGPTGASRALLPFLMAAAIAYLTRRRAIGGWLFYFYLGLFLSVFFVAAMAVPTISNLNPEGWEPFYWWMAVIDYVPWLLATVATFIFGFRLLIKSQRTQNNVIKMRYAMLAVLICSVIGTFISFRYFPDDEGGNVLSAFSLVSSAVWCLYWFVSERVQYVLTRGDTAWDYKEFRNR